MAPGKAKEKQSADPLAFEMSAQGMTSAPLSPSIHEYPTLECGPSRWPTDSFHERRDHRPDRTAAYAERLPRPGAADHGRRHDAAGERPVTVTGARCGAIGWPHSGPADLATAQNRDERLAHSDPDITAATVALDHGEWQGPDSVSVHQHKGNKCKAHHRLDLAAEGKVLGRTDRPRPDELFQPFDPAYEGRAYVPRRLSCSRYLQDARASFDRSDDALSRADRRAPPRPSHSLRHLRPVKQNPLICLTGWQDTVENIFNTITYSHMAEKQAGYEPENPRRGGHLGTALAAMGMLASGEAAATTPAAEKVAEAQTVETATAEIQAEVRNCTLETNRAFLEYFAKKIGEDLSEDEIAGLLEEFPEGKTNAQSLKWSMKNSPAIRDWVVGEVKANGRPYLATIVGDLADASSEGYRDCDRHNDEIQLAALEADIARMNAEFQKHGFRLGETVDGQTVVYRMVEEGEDFVAAYIVRDPETGEVSIDFSALNEANEALDRETEELREQIETIYDQMQKSEIIEVTTAPAVDEAVIVAAADRSDQQ